MKITQEVAAWLTGTTPYDLGKLTRSDFQPSDLYYLQTDRDFSGEGWVKVGKATIQLELDEGLDITKFAVAGLRRAQDEIRAQAAAKITEIQAQINSLLAIPMESTESEL